MSEKETAAPVPLFPVDAAWDGLSKRDKAKVLAATVDVSEAAAQALIDEGPDDEWYPRFSDLLYEVQVEVTKALKKGQFKV